MVARCELLTEGLRVWLSVQRQGEPGRAVQRQNGSVRPTGGVLGATAVPEGAAVVGVRKVNLKV